jgi:hypothetical protein
MAEWLPRRRRARFIVFAVGVPVACGQPRKHHMLIARFLVSTVLTGFERFAFSDGTVDNNDGNWLVDDLFYYAQNHDVWNAHVDADVHYGTTGWKEGRDPSAFFDLSIYLSANPDVAASGANPLTHYATVGWQQGRVPCWTSTGTLISTPIRT